MLNHLLDGWRARHVLLVGGTDALTLAMTAMLEAVGARCARIPAGASSETLCRAMTSGRIGAVIAAKAHALAPGLDPAAHLSAVGALLTEAREAGVPLVMLCSDAPVYRAVRPPASLTEEDAIGGRTPEGLVQSLVQLYALGVSQGLAGDPVRTLVVRHPPLLGGDAPSAAQYTRWCRALLAGEWIPVEQPDAQGVFLHPLEAACGALVLGALRLERARAGEDEGACAYNLAPGPQGVCPNRSAALRLIRGSGGTRPIREIPPSQAAPAPRLSAARARLSAGIHPIYSADESLALLLALERARLGGHVQAEMQRQALETLKRLPEKPSEGFAP